jgi:hypothetical protein
MKKIILILAFGLFGVYGFSQTIKAEQVPQLIKDRVQFKFPQAMDVPVAWSMAGGEYQAKLTIMDAPATIVVDTLGTIKRVERRINESYMPDKAKAYMKSLDPKYEVVSAVQITDEKEQIIYKTVVRIRTDITFDGNGNVAAKK